MKKRMKLPRRGIALAAAGATVWMVARTADLSGAWNALQGLGDCGTVVMTLLETELGKTEDVLSEAGLDGVLRLAVEDSPQLAASGDAVAVWVAQTLQAPADEEQDSGAEEVVLTKPSGETVEEEAVSSDAPPEEPPESTVEPEEPAVMTGLDISSIKASKIGVDNHTEGKSVDVSKLLNASVPLTLQPAENGPQILIMHTHATESYTMSGDDIYTETDNSRTTDENYNMIRVGEEMKAVFESYGLSVVHDKTTYDYPSYNGSYGRSLAGIQSYLKKYPTISVVLDVHRDALIGSDGTAYAKTTEIDGERVAQVMLVVGTNDSGLEHPDWKNNMTLAVRLQAAMLAIDGTLPRNIDLRSQRFNQHLTAGSLLVEVGTSGNTLQEALAGARLFAQAAANIYVQQIDGGED